MANLEFLPDSSQIAHKVYKELCNSYKWDSAHLSNAADIGTGKIQVIIPTRRDILPTDVPFFHF